MMNIFIVKYFLTTKLLGNNTPCLSEEILKIYVIFLKSVFKILCRLMEIGLLVGL